ncbi:uncharacterized protein LOC124943532 [Impatiens glandulifera]|uniref:uncharacterized protein LOC124943532 n=1 Tax=Impatiens glandulifera TaxID=253017 RepID=UPI001FB0B007|nr:uncharacterized protein LOC124943532 [Impatiens glandulifera]
MNAISEDLKQNFQENATTQDLWSELKGRYERNNGPRRYGVKKEISSIKQGSLTLEKYYSKFKMLWQELRGLKPLASSKREQPSSNAIEVGQQVILDDEEDRLLEFLMGLNESYEHIKDNILITDPLPSIHKVFTILLNVEIKREVDMERTENFNVMFTKDSHGYKEQNIRKTTASEERSSFVKQKNGTDKGKNPYKNATCQHYNMQGHVKESFFKIIGYPEWYKQPEDQRRKNFVNATASNPLDANSSPENASDLDFKLFKAFMKNMKDLKGNEGNNSNFNSGP